MDGELLSVNIARQPGPTSQYEGLTGIDKRPFGGRVRVAAPGAPGVGGSGLAGDVICTRKFHGGDDQAVYAYAREDLDWWSGQLDRPLADGMFGENLTTRGLDLAGALVGERWRVGRQVVLEVTSPRVPCQTFAEKLGEAHWVKRFTEYGATGAYLRVIEPGEIQSGDRIEVLSRPEHHVTVGYYFRVMMSERAQYPQLIAPAGDALPLKARKLLDADADAEADA
ncbi:MAG TPA: MOSC domain-containing protein [Actinocrinis sp.]|nr:MOSC domain-containing protein [Actinocrinis sp.]